MNGSETAAKWDMPGNGIAPGVWPTMVTPMTPGGEIELAGLESLTEWFIAREVAGLFAVCQSSEMFLLSLSERVALAECVVRRAGGRVGVIASGNTAWDPEQQIEELQAMAATGIDALVLVTNRFAAPEEPDAVWQNRMEHVLAKLPPHLPLGLYECPHPYPKLLSLELLRWVSSLGRFSFLKDTSCDPQVQRERRTAVEGSALGLYNANSATLLSSLLDGYAGFSGVMANFHPELYVWLCRHYRTQPGEAAMLQDFLGAASVYERQLYPLNAKVQLARRGVFRHSGARVTAEQTLGPSQLIELEQLARLQDRVAALLPGLEVRT